MAILESLLDADFYKFTMGQLVFLRHPDVPVVFSFTNRTRDVALAEVIDLADLRAELEAARELRFRDDELAYLGGIDLGAGPVFSRPYLDHLRALELPDYEVSDREGRIDLHFEGPWSTTLYWETLSLSIINELYYRAKLDAMVVGERESLYTEGERRLEAKIEILDQHPRITFAEFGTRRRFSRAWQERVVRRLAEAVPDQLAGTSNVALARSIGIRPIGTFAHELFMVYSGIHHGTDDDIRASHGEVLRDWWELYGASLSIALTDTYGSDFFFQDWDADPASRWRGLRHDSGDPIEFGEAAIAFYERVGTDPREKVIVFSDGLDVETIVRITESLADRIGVTFGWGTNLTNDLGLRSLSLVAKATEAAGHGTVKLSDNLAKATGDPDDVERFKRIFGHTVTTEEECVY